MAYFFITDGKLLADPIDCHCMIGALQYLTITKPDIAYVVHVVFQFMHAPCTSHLNVVKRIYKYLQGTADHGLFFLANSRLDIMVAVCDSNWLVVMIAVFPPLVLLYS